MLVVYFLGLLMYIWTLIDYQMVISAYLLSFYSYPFGFTEKFFKKSNWDNLIEWNINRITFKKWKTIYIAMLALGKNEGVNFNQFNPVVGDFCLRQIITLLLKTFKK